MSETDADSTRREGRAAHAAGIAHRDCPYIGDVDRWAWEQGWIEAEVEQRRRIGAMP